MEVLHIGLALQVLLLVWIEMKIVAFRKFIQMTDWTASFRRSSLSFPQCSFPAGVIRLLKVRWELVQVRVVY